MRAFCVVLLLASSCVMQATIVGVSEPARSITRSRIALLPSSEQPAWVAYLERSGRQMAADKAALAAELQGMASVPPLPKEGSSARSMPLNRSSAWYGSDEALRTADAIVSFQTPAGGWSKNLDMNQGVRLKGQSYAANNLSRYPGKDDFDTPADPQWNYVGTLDNDATVTEMLFLAEVFKSVPGAKAQVYRDSFVRGVRYLLAAQFPNGGWPQVWPLQGGYHDAITFNDTAMIHAMKVLAAVADAGGEFQFVPALIKEQAGAAVVRGMQCILATQVVLHGQRTIWGQQHDALTLEPVAGRNFEPAALASPESKDILEYLMSVPNPSALTKQAIENGVLWLKEKGSWQPFTTRAQESRAIVNGTPPATGPWWARFYSLQSETPIFGDRDKSIHTEAYELSPERQRGYSWYSGGTSFLTVYSKWKERT